MCCILRFRGDASRRRLDEVCLTKQSPRRICKAKRSSPPLSDVTRSRRCCSELPGAPPPTTLCLGLAFAQGLWTLVMPPPPRLRQDAGFLHLPLKPFEYPLKGNTTRPFAPASIRAAS